MIKAFFWLVLVAILAAAVVWARYPHLLYRFEKPRWQSFKDPAGTYAVDFPGPARCGLEADVTVGETCRHQLWNWDLRATRLGFVQGGMVSNALGKAGIGGPSLAGAEREVKLFMTVESSAPASVAGGEGMEFRGRLKKGYGVVRAGILKNTAVLFTVIVRDAATDADFKKEMARHPSVAERFFSTAAVP